MQSALKLLGAREKDWISVWVAERIASGNLWREHWIGFVTSVPEDLKQQLLDRIEEEDIQQARRGDPAALLWRGGGCRYGSGSFGATAPPSKRYLMPRITGTSSPMPCNGKSNLPDGTFTPILPSVPFCTNPIRKSGWLKSTPCPISFRMSVIPVSTFVAASIRSMAKGFVLMSRPEWKSHWTRTIFRAT